jgi:hypothetical protein
VKAFQTAGQPVISVDTKKKELVGDFKNGGRELRPKGQPEPVRTHDFPIPGRGKAMPYGIDDVADNVGWVNLGISHDTAAFAVQAFASRCASARKRWVESIRRWWHELGAKRCPGAAQLLINAYCGGSDGARVRLWKRESCLRAILSPCDVIQNMNIEIGRRCSEGAPVSTRGRVDPWVAMRLAMAGQRILS